VNKSPWKKWTDQEIALLGTMPDRDVSRITGRTDAGVIAARISRGIPPFLRAWTADELSLLGTDSDIAIANLLGRSAPAVQQKRHSLGIRPPRLAKVSQKTIVAMRASGCTLQQIADALGVSHECIRSRLRNPEDK